MIMYRIMVDDYVVLTEIAKLDSCGETTQDNPSVFVSLASWLAFQVVNQKVSKSLSRGGSYHAY